MPVYDRGYRRFEGGLSRRILGFLTIARSEILLRFSRKLLVLLLLIPSFLPALVMMIAVYVILQVVSTQGAAQPAVMLAQRFIQEIGSGYFFLFFQIHGFVVLLLWGAFVGSDLIASDRKSNALELYFTRPITRLDYLLGKFCTLVFFLLLTSLLPAMLLYAFAVAVAPEGQYFEHASYFDATRHIPGAILLYSVLQAVVTSTIVLALSSLGRSWILVGAIWGGFYIFSRVVYQIVQELSGSSKAVVLSLCDSLLAVGGKIFETSTPDDNWREAAVMLGILTLVSLLVLVRRIRVVEAAE